MDENSRAYAHLKEMILKQTESEEQTQKILKKIFNRISMIYVSLSAVIIIGLMFLIYITSRPESKASTALKEMEALNTRISLQRQYIEMDRKDLEITRNAVNELTKIQDSLIKKNGK